MSAFSKFLAGWSFRTSNPSFESGQELVAFVTGYEGGDALVRVGDSVLRLDGDADPSLVDRRVRLRVSSFDDGDHTGRAELIEVVDDAEP